MRFITTIKAILLFASVAAGLAGLGTSVSALTVSGNPSLGYVATSSKATACATLGSLDSTDGCGTDTLTSTISGIISVLSIVVGIAAVITIIVAGLKYVTSGGDSAKVGSAKSTLAYALVGVAIAALAQFLVHFALNRAVGAQPCPYNSQFTLSDAACHK
jgi:type IV secretion system pilin